MTAQIKLSPLTAEALPQLAELMRDTMSGHILNAGPPPGEYERGFADGFIMAVEVVQAAANSVNKP